MPTDGELAFTVGVIGQQQRYTLSFQALPWLETSFRYSHVTGLFSGYDEKHYYDRSFGLKARLIREEGILPDISIGVRDLLGTNVFSSEYIVASKRLGDFDLSAGMGWGELSQTETAANPLGLISQSFKERSGYSSGSVNLKQFFHGEKVGVFGGVTWQTPIEGLKVVAEYSSDKYKDYLYNGAIKPRSQANFAISYQPTSAVAISAGWYYGNTFGLVASVMGDPKISSPSALRIGPEAPRPAVRTISEQKTALNKLKETGVAWSGKNSAVSAAQLARLRLLESFYSAAQGVRDVEFQGNALIIDASLSRSPQEQCASYAKLAMAVETNVRSLVLTDYQNPKGNVVFCAVQQTPAGAPEIATANPASDSEAIQKQLNGALAEQALIFTGVKMSGSEIWVYYENYRYNRAAEAAGRVARILMKIAPPDVEIFHIIPSRFGVPISEVTITRSGLERIADNFLGGGSSIADAPIRLGPAPMNDDALWAYASKRYPSLAMSLDPKLTQRLFDPQRPIQFLILADYAALLQLMPGLTVTTEWTGALWNNTLYNRPSGSELPHVRTDVLQYLQTGRYGMSQLQAAYQTRLSPTVFTEVRAGFLEDMYAGVGGQLLWRPNESRFSFGADLYQVWQRGYSRLFSFRDYHTLTGHVSAYYRSPWYGLNYAVHAGRYLAGDYGATFEITRRFESGVEIGAWATFTNVPFKKFGEGSFDKGIIIHIPFEWGLPIWSQSAYDLRLNSLTRDGGQRLAGDDSLFGATFESSYGEFAEHLNDVVEP